MKIREITQSLEEFAPLAFQESYDNAGLLVGSPQQTIDGVLLTLDVTEDVVDEAIRKKAGLIVAHHPVIFGGVKRLTGSNYVERILIKAIKNDIAIYASHTNIDSVPNGVNGRIAQKIGLKDVKILAPKENVLRKLVTFVPEAHAEKVRTALFEAGAGQIGNYDSCSYNSKGDGTFRASEKSKPFVGEKGKIHTEKEIRIETIFPQHVQNQVITSLKTSHPYEEVAYDIYSINNQFEQAGSGIIGTLEKPEDELIFLERLKKTFDTKAIRHTSLLEKPISKVAICGGAGSFLLRNAMSKKADIFISSDFKYHQFFDADRRILIADIGHYESEQFTKDIFYEILTKKFPNFAVIISKIVTNPIKYL